MTRQRLFSQTAVCLTVLLCAELRAARGPVPGFNTSTPYLIYYGNWDSTKVDFARENYRLVVLHPQSNVRRADMAAIQRGPDNIAGTADDVLVFAYLSVGEDDRAGAPFVGDGLGPRVDPRPSDATSLSSITNSLGLPSPAGTGYASYYLDTKTAPDGIPDRNPTWGGCYVNAGAPAWWGVIKNMTSATDAHSGLDEILTSATGKGFNCDGVFLDTLDTAAPNSFGGTAYEWTAPGMQALCERISTNYPNKLILGNRGLFFYNPNYKTYAYTLRPFVNLVMFESYFTDSDSSHQITPSFPDNKYDYAPKLNAETGRPDGFTLLALGYDHSPPLPQAIIDQDYFESMGVQGWPLYRTNPYLDAALNTNAAQWLATNIDTQPPVWDSTAAVSGTQAPARVGVQQVLAGDQRVTVRWDVARDQTQPVRYNLYYTTNATMDFGSATRLANVIPAMPANYAEGTGPGVYPYEYSITGLSNGVSHLFAVRAEDSANPSHEDPNTVILASIPGVAIGPGAFRNISVDGNFSDWTDLPWSYQGTANGNTVNFAKVQFANDRTFLYGHFVLFTPAAPFSDYNTHLFFDIDSRRPTGYQVSGAAFGSEMMIESGAGYDERNGTFNAGGVSNLGWALAPGGAGTEFEFRISLAAAYAGGMRVFGTNVFRILLQDNRGDEVANGTGLSYVILPPGPYNVWRERFFTPAELINPAISGDTADPDGDGIANFVEYAFNLNPRVLDFPSLPRAFLEKMDGTNFLAIQFTQRNPPTDVLYVPETSSDLQSWSQEPAGFVQTAAVDNGDGTSVVTLRWKSPVERLPQFFFRIAVMNTRL